MAKNRTINGIDIDVKTIENTFMPDHEGKAFSLIDLYYLLDRGLVRREDVPYLDMTLLSEVEPELREMFRSKVTDDAWFIRGIDITVPFIKNTFMNLRRDKLNLLEVYVSVSSGSVKRKDVPEHVMALLENIKYGLNEMVRKDNGKWAGGPDSDL